MNITLKHIPAIVSNVNRYMNRKTSPKNLDDFWITRVSQKKLDYTWDVISDWQKKPFQDVYNDIQSNVFSVVDFAAYVALYKINNDDIFTGSYSLDDRKKICNVTSMFNEQNYAEGVGKIINIVKSANIKQAELMVINSNGSSLIQELLLNGEITLAVAVKLEPFIKSSKQESYEHKQFKKWLRILNAIRNNK